MTVAEIKAKLPEADIYELKDDARYLILLNREHINMETLTALSTSRIFPEKTLFLTLLGLEDAVRILEMSE